MCISFRLSAFNEDGRDTGQSSSGGSLDWKIEFPRDIRLDVHADLITMNIDGAHLFGNTEGAALRAKEWLFGAQHHGHSIKTVDVDY